MGFWPVVLNVLRNSDVVLLLVDARVPELGKNFEVVKKVEDMKKRIVYVFNKIDLVSKKDVDELRRGYRRGFFVSCKKRIGVEKLRKALIEMADNWKRESLRVGIVGYPNVGKSSLINLLVSSAKTRVSSVSGTTRKTQWIRSGKLRIMDSPGVIPFKDSKFKVGIVSGKDPHKIRNPEEVAFRIIKFLNGKDDGILKEFYGVSGGSVEELFRAIGLKKGYLIKGGEIDENRTAIKVIEDWQCGKIKLK
jgi:ribosome biogenesis GTPase A